MLLFSSKNKAKLKFISKFLLFNTKTVSKQTYMLRLINKMFLFSTTKEFLMQGITHLWKTLPHNLESYMNCRNFYEIASYNLIFVLLVASCLRTNYNGSALH